MEKVQAVVIGAGVVGIAVARQLARCGLEVLVLEKGSSIGCGTSSRNSEVIHRGIYYPKDSYKARFCVEGHRLLYDFCNEYEVCAKDVGKLIVATSDDQVDGLRALLEKAERNGVHDLRWMTKEDTRVLEPEVKCVAGLYSPWTGIVDSHAFMLAMQGDAESHGCTFIFNSEVAGGQLVEDKKVVLRSGGCTLDAEIVFNCAGLSASRLAVEIGTPSHRVTPTLFAKGNYYRLEGVKAPFSHLIYPVPEAHGLGVHATVDLGGNTRFGPDVEWTENCEDYKVDVSRSLSFYREIRKYWPQLPDNSLVPDYAGIRPKAYKPGCNSAGDFVFEDFTHHGIKNLVNFIGIESPGLTSALALGQFARRWIAP